MQVAVKGCKISDHQTKGTSAPIYTYGVRRGRSERSRMNPVNCQEALGCPSVGLFAFLVWYSSEYRDCRFIAAVVTYVYWQVSVRAARGWPAVAVHYSPLLCRDRYNTLSSEWHKPGERSVHIRASLCSTIDRMQCMLQYSRVCSTLMRWQLWIASTVIAQLIVVQDYCELLPLLALACIENRTSEGHTSITFRAYFSDK